MKTHWKDWLYNPQGHTFIHKEGFMLGDSFLSDFRADDEIQGYLDHMEFILKAAKQEEEKRLQATEESKL